MKSNELLVAGGILLLLWLLAEDRPARAAAAPSSPPPVPRPRTSGRSVIDEILTLELPPLPEVPADDAFSGGGGESGGSGAERD